MSAWSPMPEGTGTEQIEFDQPVRVNVAGTGHPNELSEDWEPELFPDDRPKGPLSKAFRSAQRFRRALHSDDDA